MAPYIKPYTRLQKKNDKNLTLSFFPKNYTRLQLKNYILLTNKWFLRQRSRQRIKNINYIKSIGKELGYPDCCIDEHIKTRISGTLTTCYDLNFQLSDNTGFVPCWKCSNKILYKYVTLENLIKNRIYYKPFPNL